MAAVLCRKGFMGLFLGLVFFSFSFSFSRNNSTGSCEESKTEKSFASSPAGTMAFMTFQSLFLLSTWKGGTPVHTHVWCALLVYCR